MYQLVLAMALPYSDGLVRLHPSYAPFGAVTSRLDQIRGLSPPATEHFRIVDEYRTCGGLGGIRRLD
jgi:hypothetical protein